MQHRPAHRGTGIRLFRETHTEGTHQQAEPQAVRRCEPHTLRQTERRQGGHAEVADREDGGHV